MKYRSVANGNIVDDAPEPLVAAGLYVPIDVDQDEGAPTQASAPAVPESAADSAARKGRRRR